MDRLGYISGRDPGDEDQERVDDLTPAEARRMLGMPEDFKLKPGAGPIEVDRDLIRRYVARKLDTASFDQVSDLVSQYQDWGDAYLAELRLLDPRRN